MAANDYYYDGAANHTAPQQTYQQPYQQPYVVPTESPAPPYYAQGQGVPVSSTPSPAPPTYPPSLASRSNNGTPRPSQQPLGPSPFETVFDDHVYPDTDSRGRQAGANAGYYNQDTAYHGGAAAAYNSNSSSNNDIPLQDRHSENNKNPDPEAFEDHVYDQPKKKKSGKGKVSFGQLGMLGANNKRFPFLVYTFSIIQIAVFIGELVKNGVLTGSPIMIKPSFNPMIGPSTWVMINMGGRYTPCMHNIPKIQGHVGTIGWACPNTTSSDAGSCTLSDLCGMGGVPNPKYDGNEDQSPEPNQWWRFITPVFMHAGIIHIGFNLMMQLTVAKEMECAIGSIRFFFVYISGGIFGNVLGANYAGDGLLSTGASGALFSCIALLLLDLLYSWGDRRNPTKDLAFIMMDIIVSFVLGLLPGLDNFAHIGGFIMGLGLGIALLHSPNALRRRLGLETPYTTVSSGVTDRQPSFLSNPAGFFKGRKPLWWAWWLIRAGSLLAMIIAFVVLLNNFYKYHNSCSWCKYLSCIPVKDWCESGDLQITENS